MSSILIVEDERPMRRVIALLLEEAGYHVDEVETGEAAVELSARQPFDLILLDLNLPGISGLEAMAQLRARQPDLACIVLTAFGSIRSAVKAMQAGAFTYITKPFDNDELLLAIRRAIEHQQLSSEVKLLRSELASRYGFDEIVGTSAGMRSVFQLMQRLAALDVTVLILGESGTGKELVARGIHNSSKRSSGPFVPVNCAAIPSTLIEAEFFGHERGAFTDAQATRRGRFEEANGGTIFLDEVGDLAIDAQAKLLRVLQNQEVVRLGSSQVQKVNVRVISATHRDLEAAIATGAFRSDLYWRLNVVSLKIPPLRDRLEDLPVLVDHILERLNRDLGTSVNRISAEAMRQLVAYPWPGNVRELENALTRALVLSQSGSLDAENLPPRLRPENHEIPPPVPPELAGLTLAAAVEHATARIERTLIQSTLLEHGGSRTATAAHLGINRKTLFNKMRAYGLGTDDGETEDEPVSNESGGR